MSTYFVKKQVGLASEESSTIYSDIQELIKTWDWDCHAFRSTAVDLNGSQWQMGEFCQKTALG